MTCYEIAKRIMRRLRLQSDYRYAKCITHSKLEYYDDSINIEYFRLEVDDVKVYVIDGKIDHVRIKNPGGIILFNLRLWLLNVDRITK